MSHIQLSNFPGKMGDTYEVHELEKRDSINYEKAQIARFHCVSSKGSGLWKRIRKTEKGLVDAGAKTPVIIFDHMIITDDVITYTCKGITVYESFDTDTDTYYLIFECYSEDVKERKLLDETAVPENRCIRAQPSSPRKR